MSNHEGYPDSTADRAVERVMRSARRRIPLSGGNPPVRRTKAIQSLELEEKLSVPYFARRFPLPIVYICSPFGEEEEKTTWGQVRRARQYCRFAISRSCVPLAPRLLYACCLREEMGSERKIGIHCGLCLLDKCSELWVFGNNLTYEMECEIWRAHMRSKRIRWFTEDLKEVERELPDSCRSMSEPVKRKKQILKEEAPHE